MRVPFLLAQLAIREMAENRVLAIVSGLLGVLAVVVLVNTFLRFPSRQRAISIE